MHIEEIAADPTVRRARRIVRETDAETLADLVELVQIPAPPFGESARGERVAERFRDVGLADVSIDAVGNVLARLAPRLDGSAHAAAAGAKRAPSGGDVPGPLLLAAHLDTVFPESTDVSIRREGDRLIAPGVADDARGLAGLLAVGRALVRDRKSVV